MERECSDGPRNIRRNRRVDLELAQFLSASRLAHRGRMAERGVMEINVIYLEGDGDAIFYASGHHEAEIFIQALQENREFQYQCQDFEIKATVKPVEIEHQHWRHVFAPQYDFEGKRLWFQSAPGRGAKKVTVYEATGFGLGFVGDWP